MVKHLESDEQFLEMISNLTFSDQTKNNKCVNQCINELVQDRINMLKDEIEFLAKHRIMTRLKNFKLEIEIINISDEILSIKEKMCKCKYMIIFQLQQTNTVVHMYTRILNM